MNSDQYEQRMRSLLGDPEGQAAPRPIILPWLLWVFVIVFSIGGVAVLSGCSTMDGFCALQPIGQTDDGVMVVRYHCEPSK